MNVCLLGAYGDNKDQLWSRKVIVTKLIINHRVSWISVVYCNQTEIITMRGKQHAPSLRFCCWFQTAMTFIINWSRVLLQCGENESSCAKEIKDWLFLQTTHYATVGKAQVQIMELTDCSFWGQAGLTKWEKEGWGSRWMNHAHNFHPQHRGFVSRVKPKVNVDLF